MEPPRDNAARGVMLLVGADVVKESDRRMSRGACWMMLEDQKLPRRGGVVARNRFAPNLHELLTSIRWNIIFGWCAVGGPFVLGVGGEGHQPP